MVALLLFKLLALAALIIFYKSFKSSGSIKVLHYHRSDTILFLELDPPIRSTPENGAKASQSDHFDRDLFSTKSIHKSIQIQFQL